MGKQLEKSTNQTGDTQMPTFVLLIVDIFLHRLLQPWSSCLQTGQREKVQQKWKI